MLRVISFFLLLIISQISHAETIAATYVPAVSAATLNATKSDVVSARADVCAALNYDYVISSIGKSGGSFLSSTVGAYNDSQVSCKISFTYLDSAKNLLTTTTSTGYFPYSTTYTCSSGYQSDYYGTASTSGKYCTVKAAAATYTCPVGYYRSDSNGVESTSGAYCTKTKTACTDSAGLTLKLWVSKTNPPSTGCYAGCTVQASVVAGFPDSSDVYQQLDYVSKDEVCTGVFSDVDAATATAANQAAADAKAAADAAAAEEAALQAAKDACGSAGYTTGTADGKTVVACKVPDSPAASSATSTDTTSSATGTSGSTSDGTSGSTSGGTSGSTSGGTSGSTSGGTSGSTSGSDSGATSGASGTDPSDTPAEEEEESGDGGASFSEPGEGTDYLKDVFGESDLSDLKSQNEELKKQITQKMSDVKSIFNIGSLSVAGDIADNTQEIKGSSVDLSGKKLFDQLSVLAAIFYLCAIAAAIYIVLGGRK